MPRTASLLAVALSALAGAQDFVRVEVTLPPPVVHAEVRPGITFLLTPEYAAIRRGAEVRKLDSTTPTGAWHELAVLPWGMVVVACERGLFVGDAEQPVLDAADLRDGAPSAGVRSVAADARGRLWWCSENEFGVLDPRLRFGRVFHRADGLPAPPYERLALGADGRVLLATAQGTFAYQPDAGPAPRATTAPTVDMVGSAADEYALVLDVQARGGASLRVRRQHHHLLQPLPDGRIRGLRPGRHTLEVHAFDRDLRSTLAGRVPIVVPSPGPFDPRFLLAGAAVLAASFFAWGWSRARGRAFAGRLAHVALRTAVLGVVLLQLLAAALGYGRGWPFVGFSMYTETWRENDVIYRPRITGIRADGERVALHEHDVGVHQDGYWQMLAEVAFGGEDAARAFFAKVESAQVPGAPPFVGFVLADGRIRLTADGPVDVAPTVLVDWRRP